MRGFLAVIALLFLSGCGLFFSDVDRASHLIHPELGVRFDTVRYSSASQTVNLRGQIYYKQSGEPLPPVVERDDDFFYSLSVGSYVGEEQTWQAQRVDSFKTSRFTFVDTLNGNEVLQINAPFYEPTEYQIGKLVQVFSTDD